MADIASFLNQSNMLLLSYDLLSLMILHLLTADNSKISIGIAGPDIAEDGRPGHWINSVGYSSDGVCLTSHNETANTSGQSYNTGQV